jgi:hypothetical protein
MIKKLLPLLLLGGCTTTQSDAFMARLCANQNDARAAALAAISAAQFISDQKAQAATIAAANLTLSLIDSCPAK